MLSAAFTLSTRSRSSLSFASLAFASSRMRWIGQARRSLDADFLLLARTFILGRYVEDAVRIDIEGHFDLGHTPRCSGNTVEVETADRFVVACHLAFTLQDVDLYRRLVVRGGRENFALAGRDRRVGVDQAREHAAHRLDTQ